MFTVNLAILVLRFGVKVHVGPATLAFFITLVSFGIDAVVQRAFATDTVIQEHPVDLFRKKMELSVILPPIQVFLWAMAYVSLAIAPWVQVQVDWVGRRSVISRLADFNLRDYTTYPKVVSNVNFKP